MIGLKRGTVQLCEHEKEWEIEAQNTIARLKEILGDGIKDIQHVGSTSILTIKAKPIIDIAIAVDNFDDILAYEKELKDAGFYYRPNTLAALRGLPRVKVLLTRAILCDSYTLKIPTA